MRQKLEILGIGFSNYKNKEYEIFEELIFESVENAVKNAEIDFKDIDSVIFCEQAESRTENKPHFAGIIKRYGALAGKNIYALTFEGMYGLYAACSLIGSGLHKTIMVVACGNPAGKIAVPEISVKLGMDPETANFHGPLLITGTEMKKYLDLSGETRAQCAEIVAASKVKALKNERACFGSRLSCEQVLMSEFIKEPLSAMDVSPFLDASVAIILSVPSFAGKSGKIRVESICRVYDTEEPVLAAEEFAYSKQFENTLKKMYKNAAVKNPAGEIDVFEMEDSYSFQLLQSIKMAYPAKKTTPFEIFEENIDKINPSGGCLGMGNPRGARGLMRIAEAVLQLQEVSGPNQVKVNKGRALVQIYEGLPSRGGAAVLLSRK